MIFQNYLLVLILIFKLNPFTAESGEKIPQLFSVKLLQSGVQTSLRGLSVVDDQVAWVSGSNGWVARTADRGRNWQWMQVSGFETTDFRDIEAFSDREAVLLSAGSPLLILRTEDGGKNWILAHRDDRDEIFFDGMDFGVPAAQNNGPAHRQETEPDKPTLSTRATMSTSLWGIAFGDAIDGRMPLLVTGDGGRSWQDITAAANLRIADGEAGFAASGTSIRVVDGRIYIGTGGSQSRLLCSDDGGLNWESHSTTMLQGGSSTGIFSIAFRNAQEGVVVGGDYMNDRNPDRTVLLTKDGGRSWQAPEQGTGGYRSAVEYISDEKLIACGTSGVDISTDGGQNWHSLTGEGYHVVRKAKNGNWLLLAGANGRIGELVRF